MTNSRAGNRSRGGRGRKSLRSTGQCKINSKRDLTRRGPVSPSSRQLSPLPGPSLPSPAPRTEPAAHKVDSSLALHTESASTNRKVGHSDLVTHRPTKLELLPLLSLSLLLIARHHDQGQLTPLYATPQYAPVTYAALPRDIPTPYATLGNDTPRFSTYVCFRIKCSRLGLSTQCSNMVL